jgi:hypothetical protein
MFGSTWSTSSRGRPLRARASRCEPVGLVATLTRPGSQLMNGRGVHKGFPPPKPLPDPAYSAWDESTLA